MNRSAIPCFLVQVISVPLTYSGPLSTLIAAGLPRHSMYEADQNLIRWIKFPPIGSSARTTRAAGSEKSTSVPSPSRLKSSSRLTRPERSSVGQLVRHEIHRPGLVGEFRHGQGVGPVALQALPWLDPQVQFKRAIDAVDPLVVPGEALDVPQIQEAQAEAPRPVRRRQA
jgi:hypothetical protein